MSRYESQSKMDIAYGGWPVREALEANRVLKVFLSRSADGEHVQKIVSLAKEKGIPFVWVDRKKIDQMTKGHHQGVVAQVSPFEFEGFDFILDIAKKSDFKGPRILFLDGIMDPQNLGAILRSAYYFGIPGVVIPKWRAASVSDAVVRASAGAAQFMPVAQVSNLVTAMEATKKAGIWMVGADMAGEDCKKVDLPRPFALVMGSEGEGLHQLVRKNCELIVAVKRIQKGAGIDSLNVSAASAVLLHQFSS